MRYHVPAKTLSLRTVLIILAANVLAAGIFAVPVLAIRALFL